MAWLVALRSSAAEGGGSQRGSTAPLLQVVLLRPLSSAFEQLAGQRDVVRRHLDADAVRVEDGRGIKAGGVLVGDERADPAGLEHRPHNLRFRQIPAAA